MSRPDASRLLTPTRVETRESFDSTRSFSSAKRFYKKKPAHNFIVPTISVNAPSDDGHGAPRDDSDDDDVPLSQRGGRSNSLKRAQKQVADARHILGDNIAVLEDPEKQRRSDSLGEGNLTFSHVSSRRSNRMLTLIVIGVGTCVGVTVLVIGILAAVRGGNPF